MDSKMEQDEIIRDRLERMVALQQAMEDPRDALNDARREARADGLNVEALNALLPLMSKYPHDKGAGVLNEIIRYAKIYGAENLTSAASVGSQSSPEPSFAAEAEKSVKTKVRTPAASDRDRATHDPLRLSTQVIAALGLTICLIWFLN